MIKAALGMYQIKHVHKKLLCFFNRGSCSLNFERSYNPIDCFDFAALNDPEFREDAVREEIISPVLKAIGYSSTKPYKIIRSKPLQHPFISIGSARKKVTCIPDYLLEVSDRFAWVLEAKGPNENILDGKHVEQTYSYAIHSEIRVPMFALCNGREFVLFHISEMKPILHFKMELIAKYLESLKKYLGPENVLSERFKLAKDFGMHVKRLGFGNFDSLVFPSVSIGFIAQLDNDLFTTSSAIKTEEGDSYAMSFDFSLEVLEQLRGKVPDSVIDTLTQREPDRRKNVVFSDGQYRINIDCRLGIDIQENSDEIFLPFIISSIL